jgi:pimeloyl-ACP methyl ester carboxylesterase
VRRHNSYPESRITHPSPRILHPNYLYCMQQLLLLHGAIGAKDQLDPLAESLKDRFEVHTLNFNGHGGEALPNDFSISGFANDVSNYLEQNNIRQINIFGYSMGGYVAMYLAKHHPQFVNKVITLATKFYWDEVVATKEVKMLDADIMLEKIPAFAKQLEQRHSPTDWKTVLEKTKEMLLELGKNNILKLEDYKEISIPCLLLLGDKDKMISLEETVAVHKALPNATFKSLPDTNHPIEQIDVNLLSSLIREFVI